MSSISAGLSARVSKKDKKKFEDPGVSFTNMDVPGMRWHDKKERRRNDDISNANFSKQERRRIMKEGIIRFLPKFVCMILGFAAAFLILALWLRCANS